MREVRQYINATYEQAPSMMLPEMPYTDNEDENDNDDNADRLHRLHLAKSVKNSRKINVLSNIILSLQFMQKNYKYFCKLASSNTLQ